MKAVSARTTAGINIGAIMIAADNGGAKVVKIVSVKHGKGRKGKQTCAKVGDWVVGLKEKSEKLEDHYLLFAMQITEKIAFDEYWTNPRFQLKRPDFSVDEEIFRMGDNIYELGPDGEFIQQYSAHSRDNYESAEEWEKQKREVLIL